MRSICSSRGEIPAASRARRGRDAAAFSLVELLVVIGIIVLLVGLVVGVGSAVVQRGQQRFPQAAITRIAAPVRIVEAIDDERRTVQRHARSARNES